MSVEEIPSIMDEGRTAQENNTYVDKDHRVKAQNILDELPEIGVARVEQLDCFRRHARHKHDGTLVLGSRT